MPLLDWIFLTVLLLSMLLGASRGLIYEALSLVNWLIALMLAQWLGAPVAEVLPLDQLSTTFRYGAGFVLVFIVVLLLGALVAATIKKLVAAVGLGLLDRMLGALFGVLRTALLLLLATAAAHMTGYHSSQNWQQSKAAALGEVALIRLEPLLPPNLKRLWSSQTLAPRLSSRVLALPLHHRPPGTPPKARKEARA